MRFCYLLLFFVLISSITLVSSESINVDIVNKVPYIDYLITFDSNFSINLPDYTDLIYLKTIPEDLNYTLKDNKLTVFDNTKGALILKYHGTEFLDSTNNLEKTLKFDLLKPSKITLKSDENIIETNTNYTLENDTYIWNTNNKEFILFIKLYKSPFDLKTIIIILVCLVIIAILLVPKLFAKYKIKKEDNNLILSSNQKDILDLVRKDSKLTQQDIANKLNIRKSHMSKILNKMERNNLIERKKVGKVNKIILVEK